MRGDSLLAANVAHFFCCRGLDAEWLKLLIRHIPDKGEHLVRYYGWYSSRCRGERRRMLEESEIEEGQPANVAMDQQPAPAFAIAARSAWARLIRKVYEVDPLICPHCGGEMWFLAVIDGNCQG